MGLRRRLERFFGGSADAAPPPVDAPQGEVADPSSDGHGRGLDEVLDAVANAAPGGGRLVLLEGHTGYGKSSLLAEACRRARRIGGEGAPEIVLVACYETGTGIPLSAFGDVLTELCRDDGHNRRVRARRVLEIISEAAPLLQFVPIAGAPLAAGTKVATGITLRSLGTDAAPEATDRSREVVAALRRVAEQEAALAILVDDAHWLDDQSVDVVLRLLRELPAAPIALVLAYDVDQVAEDAPLSALQKEADRSPAAARLTLPPLRVADVRRLVVETFGAEPSPNLAPWLCEAAEGNPLFVATYLESLREQGVATAGDDGVTLDGTIDGSTGSWSLAGRIADLPEPKRVRDVVRPQLERLDDDERELLGLGAVQGKRFLTGVVGRVLGQDESAVVERLRRIRQRRRVIAFDSSDDWWLQVTDVCAFAPTAVRELLYDTYRETPSDLRRRHRAVAEALEALVAERPAEPPRRVLVEIAEHLAAAGEHAQAASRFVDVAEATRAEGGTREAEAHAERALRLVRAAESVGRADDALLARAITVLLVVSEPHWAGEQQVAGTPLGELAAEAIAAADRANDPKLRSDARYARALITMAFGRLTDAYGDLQEARALAREADDPLAEAAILVEYGHHLDQEDLRAGRAVVQEAWELVSGPALEGRVPAKQLELVRAQVSSALGVADYDLGNYGDALEHLETAGPRLSEARAAESAGWAFSFLAQLRTAIGLFSEADEALSVGLALFDKEARPTAVRAFLTGFRGHLLLEAEPRRLEEAEAALAQSAEEARRAGNLGIVPLVACYRAEAALGRGEEGRLREADALLAEAVERSDEFGWKRGAIGGRALQARVALALGEPERAVALSAAAVDALAAVGGEIPVFRSEEILYTRARILVATAGDPAEPLTEARRRVDAKAASLPDAARREAFLTRVRLTRAILAATGGR